MKVFDFHSHIFPDDLAAYALGKLSYGSHITPYTDGTLAGTSKIMEAAGICGFNTLHIATNPKQQHNVNSFAIATAKLGQAYAFGSVHPSSSEALTELDRIAAAGLKGIKMHPDYQGFQLSNRVVYPIFERCQELGLIVLFHAGHDPAFMDALRASVVDIQTVANDFKKLKFVAAHMGGLMLGQEVYDTLAGKCQVYFDTSCSVGFLDKELATKIIQRHGAENILFGSDCPWGDPKAHREYVDSLPLTDNQKEMIFYNNAKRLLGLT